MAPREILCEDTFRRGDIRRHSGSFNGAARNIARKLTGAVGKSRGVFYDVAIGNFHRPKIFSETFVV
ncbi:hypothetical protein FACS1894139_10190 [Planctomycetales bacterium]|nr:hypothetical protein FACS1894108_04710 [Planctomycetales bacterium]GHT05769.1 hypothetical protein FACS1894139_10190 [Planctomycetales bacterium]